MSKEDMHGYWHGNNSNFKCVSLNFSYKKRINFNNPFGTTGYLIPNILQDLGMTVCCTKY